jgi:3'-phosphoadenosine 5'-phosphosulfate sulfotransferase (PAPS reductase)/FAD synthetase
MSDKTINKRKYGWKGLKVPLRHLNDPDYCEIGCPICTSARKGNRLAGFIQKFEMLFFPRGCWWGRAREKKYGVKPDQPLPPKSPH